MAWSLIGVILIEFLLLLESLIVFVWWLLVKGVRSLHLVDNSRRYMAYRKEKKATQNRENREEEERLLRLALAQEKTKQTETKATDDASASEEQAPTSKEDTEEN